MWNFFPEKYMCLDLFIRSRMKRSFTAKILQIGVMNCFVCLLLENEQTFQINKLEIL